ncbi:MAG: Gfo/Idh/MocA family oxidoreductase [Planctomycetaceae bacterium]|nr:Gfo/Idh/MocA family oxidoreductase [Planctomycetaceae bacterium]
MKKIRYAVIGAGALGRHHARIAAGLDGVELVAVAEPNAVQGQTVARDNGSRWVADYREVLDSVDAASIVVPTSLHRRIAEECIAHGVACLVEKPLAGNIEDGREIVKAAEEQGITLQVGHIERFNPAFEELATRVHDPKYLRVERFSPYAFRSMDISVIHDLMIHDLDLVLTLTASPITHVDAFGVCLLGGYADAVQARLKFANGCVADLSANRVNPEFRRWMQAWSASGCVTADLHNRKVTHHQPTDKLLNGPTPHALAQLPGADIPQLKEAVFGEYIETDEPQIGECDQLTAEIGHFVDCLRNGSQPLVDGRAGLAALEVADQVHACVDAHQWNGNAAGSIGSHVNAVHATRRAA